MKIKDIYNLPTIDKRDDWFYSSSFLKNMSLYEENFDRIQKENIPNNDMLIENKLYRCDDGRRSVSYDVYTYKNQPFALYVSSGRDGDENENFYITDKKVMKEAFDYALSFAENSLIEEDITDPNEDIPSLNSNYGHIVYKDEVDGVTKLVTPSEFIKLNNDEYIYVFDINEKIKNIEKYVRELYNNWDGKNSFNSSSFFDEQIRNAYCHAIFETLRIPKENKFILSRNDVSDKDHKFSSVAFLVEDQCYVICNNPMGFGLSWIRGNKIQHVGDKEFYEKLKLMGPENIQPPENKAPKM